MILMSTKQIQYKMNFVGKRLATDTVLSDGSEAAVVEMMWSIFISNIQKVPILLLPVL